MPRKKILILTADAGFGHRRAAEAIQAALDELYSEQAETVVANPLQAADAPGLIRQLVDGFDDIVAGDPTLYRIAYHATDGRLVADIMEVFSARLLNDTMQATVQEVCPDVVVTTYPAYAQPVAWAVAKTERDTTLAVVITDLTDVHSLWYSPAATLHFAPTFQIRQQAIQNKIPATRVRVTGLPVHPSFAREARDSAVLRKELGWDTDRCTCLVAGSARMQQVKDIVRLLDRAELGLQLAVVTGDAHDLYQELQNEEWRGKVHIYGRVDNMPQMMRAADFLISKAGGLIVSESLACGLPLLIAEALPGQEMGNARYVADGGAGVWVSGAAEVLATVFSWSEQDYAPLEELRANARKLGRPRAAYDIAEKVWGLG